MEVNRYQKENLMIENVPAIPVSLVQKLRSFQNVRGASFSAWLPADQGMLIFTRFAEAAQIHRVMNPGGMRRQLTFFGEPVGGGEVCPDPKVPYFLFTKDSAGDEQHQIYKFNYADESYEMLTDGKARNEACLWTNRGDRFAFSSTMRNGRDFDVWVGDLEGTPSFQIVAQEGGTWYPIDWSPDDSSLLLLNYISANESYYHILNLAEKRLEKLNPQAQKIAYGMARWSRDGKGIFLISDQFSEFWQLLYYDLQSKTFKVLTEKISWDIEDFDLADDGQRIALIANEGGWSALYLLAPDKGDPVSVPLPQGQIFGVKFKPDSKSLAVVLNTSRAPSDVYVRILETGEMVRWTESETAGLATKDFVDPVLIRYPTFDTAAGQPRLIPAFYYRPKNTPPPFPVLIICHGGPEGQYKPSFASLTEYYLDELGIAVIFPNVRGSSGYGKGFLELDNGGKREDAVKDVGALLDWIAGNPELDCRRVAVSGGSYGGYMALAVMTNYPDRLCGGVDFCGISNFVTFLESTAEYRRDRRRFEYGDEREPAMREFLNRISPLTNAGKIRKPMFIVQGRNDPRVSVTEAEQMVKAIRDNGVEVWYLRAEDEGHGFAKKANRDYYNQAFIMFLKKFLKP